MTAALLGFFVVTLDAVILNVALPQIGADLNGSIAGLQWVVDAYTLMFAALLLSGGSLADRVGARRSFGIGLLVFVVASAGCGLAPSLAALIVARLVQGSAAAILMPASMTLVTHAYPDPARRARAVAWWSMGGVAAATSGPLLGGLLTTVSWRLIFFVNVPIGLVAMTFLARTVRAPHHVTPFDWAGQVAAVLGMSGLTYGAIETGAAGAGSPRAISAFAVATVAITGFLVLQARGRHPMMPLDLFRSRTVSIAMVTGFAFMVGYYGLPFVMSLYFQQMRGLSALDTGISFLPMMVIGAVLNPFTPRLAERFGPRSLVATGLVAMAVGLVVIGVAPAATPIVGYSLSMILVGIAGPFVMPPIMALLLHAVPPRRAGVASGVFNSARQIGGALAVAVFGALLADPETFVHGLRVSVFLAAAVAAVTAVVSLRLTPADHAVA